MNILSDTHELKYSEKEEKNEAKWTIFKAKSTSLRNDIIDFILCERNSIEMSKFKSHLFSKRVKYTLSSAHIY